MSRVESRKKYDIICFTDFEIKVINNLRKLPDIAQLSIRLFHSPRSSSLATQSWFQERYALDALII